MHHLSTSLLIERFRKHQFQDYEIAPYFVVTTMLHTIAMSFFPGFSSTLDIISSIILILGTYAGIMHVRNKNGGTFGNGYINKWYTLGWVTFVRTVLIGFPIIIVLALIGSAIDHQVGTQIASLAFTIIIQFIYYYWLGELVAKTNTTDLDLF